jgi:arsenate reductase (thioredoxin)
MKILILCTGNSCRSQMVEGILKNLDPALQVFSAGTEPAKAVSRRAISVMQEIGIDISKGSPKNVDLFLKLPFDYVITVCDHANETCPVFIGKVNKRLHMGFPDPTKYEGEPEVVIQEFRRVRDEMLFKFTEFYNAHIK